MYVGASIPDRYKAAGALAGGMTLAGLMHLAMYALESPAPTTMV